MFTTLPTTTDELLSRNVDWAEFEPFYADLQARPLTADTAAEWLADWSRISGLLAEVFSRLHVATTVNTADMDMQGRFQHFIESIIPPMETAEQALKLRLLESGIEPKGFDIQLRNMRAQTALFREENLPLIVEVEKLGREYDAIAGAQTAEWDGKMLPLAQIEPFIEETDRDVRERAWRTVADRRLQDRPALDAIWTKLYHLRQQIARNAGFDNYRDYRWREFLRFDYTPEDTLRFHEAVEQIVTPVLKRRRQRRKDLLGLETLRPWDLAVDPHGRPPLRPFTTADELNARTEAIFTRVDPDFGAWYATMRREGLLDLESREHKSDGGYMTYFPVARRPFIFANAAGTADDVNTMLHEGGHAFHGFEAGALPYYQQLEAPIEFSEVASMAMELLAAPYLPASEGGFYTAEEAARNRTEHLERVLFLWAYVCVGDAFQQWIYTHEEAADPAACDARYVELWRRFMPVEDWTGLEVYQRARWQRVLHFFLYPFYYLEYGLAQLGAVQVWANARRDQQAAVAAYRRALGLGNTRPLGELFQTAGAKFSLDADTLREAVQLVETTLNELDAVRD